MNIISMLTLAMLVGFNSGMAVSQMMNNKPCKYSVYAAIVIFGLLLIDFAIYLINI